MEHVLFGAFIVVGAFVFAKLEIQIEGPHGWAANLPTWRIDNRWTQLLYSGRPLTGYHLYLQAFLAIMVHTPMAFFPQLWSWGFELKAIAFFILIFLTEDFMWFVVNPAFGLKRFRPQHIPWHAPTWWLIAPRDYWLFSVVAIAAYFYGHHLMHPPIPH